MIFLAHVERSQFTSQFREQPLPMLPLAFGLKRIEAQYIAFAPLAVADPDLLDLEIVGDLAIAARSRQNRGVDLLHPAHRHRQHVAAKTTAQRTQVIG